MFIVKMLSFLMWAPVFFGQTLVVVEQYATTEKSDNHKTTPTSDVWFQQNIAGKVGMFVWGQIGPTYRQAYAGGSYQFTSWLQAGVGGGAEQAESIARLGSFVYASKNNESFFGIYENGGSGRWHLAQYNHAIGKSRYGLGVHNQAFVGTGPRAEANFGPVEVWVSALWEKGGHNLMYGVKYTYFKGKEK